MRYLRLFYRFIEFSLGKAFQFRFDFFFRVVMDLVFYFVNIAFFQIIFLHTPDLGGWNSDQMMIFVAGFCVLDAMSMTLFSNNLWWLPQYVNRGDLDYYLVRPVSSLFFLSLRDFAANSFINFLMSLGILAWAIHRYPGDFGPAKVVLYFAYLMIGLVIHYLVRMVFLMPVFWTQSSFGFDAIYFQMSRVLERPDGIFRGWSRFLFTGLLPFSLMASFPARLVVEAFDGRVFLHLIGVTALFCLIVGWLWRAGLRSYSSASS